MQLVSVDNNRYTSIYSCVLDQNPWCQDIDVGWIDMCSPKQWIMTTKGLIIIVIAICCCSCCWCGMVLIMYLIIGVGVISIAFFLLQNKSTQQRCNAAGICNCNVDYYKKKKKTKMKKKHSYFLSFATRCFPFLWFSLYFACGLS